MKIIILGNKGMLGHVVERYLREKKHNVIGFNRTDFDMADFKTLNEKILKFLPQVIINCVGILNTGKDIQEFGRINVALPHYLEHICDMNAIRLIHISTNCVYDNIGPHKFEDEPDAKNWYGVSKALGEVNSSKHLTIRTSIIGPELKDGSGLMNWFMHKSDKDVNGYINAIWNGVITLQLAKFIENECLNSKHTNIINYHTKDSISKYELFKEINEIYDLNKNIIKTINTAHSSILIGHFTTKSYEDQLKELNEWY